MAKLVAETIAHDHAFMPDERRSFSCGALVGTVVAGLVLVCAAVFISTEAWASWFQHPAREPLPEVTKQGAALWRVMLGVCAFVLVAAGWVLSRCRNDARTTHSVSARSRKRLVGLLALVAVALVVRATRVTESLWYDEIAAWLSYGAGIDSPGPIIGNYFDPVNHVLCTLLSWLSVRALESWMGSEMAMRLPALLVSLGSVVAMYGLGRALVGERAGWIAGWFMAIAPVSALEGVEARGYSMMVFFSAAATWLLVEARSRKRPWLWIAYAACCALGVWAHFVTAFVPIGHGMWLAWRAMRSGTWRDELCAFTALGLAATLSITLYAPIIPEMLSTRGVFFSTRGDEPGILGAEGIHALLQLGGSWYWWAAMPGLVMVCVGLAALSHKRQLDVLVLTMIGLTLFVLLVWASGSWMYARFTFFALPGALLVMTAGLDALWSKRREFAFIALAILAMVWIADLWVRPPKQPLREAAEIVRQHSEESDHIVVVGLAHEVMRVYLDDRPLTYSLRHGHDLQSKLQAVQPRLVIVEYPDHVSASTFDMLHQRGFVQIARLDGWVDWGHGDVVVMGRN